MFDVVFVLAEALRGASGCACAGSLLTENGQTVDGVDEEAVT